MEVNKIRSLKFYLNIFKIQHKKLDKESDNINILIKKVLDKYKLADHFYSMNKSQIKHYLELVEKG